MKNIVATTASVSSDRGGENVLDDVHSFVGEEMQWRIFLSSVYDVLARNFFPVVGAEWRT
jgi:hypothetical protein